MTPNLILGPLLRYAGTTDATVWVETDAPCTVEVTTDGLAHRSPTFTVEGHPYALVRPTGLERAPPCRGEGPADGPAPRSPAFTVEGHHYALVRLTGLEPASIHEYSVSLDGKPVWPEAGSDLPPSTIRTTGSDGEFVLAYGSCRVAVPHEPPYTLERGAVMRGGLGGKRHERGALFAPAHQ